MQFLRKSTNNTRLNPIYRLLYLSVAVGSTLMYKRYFFPKLNVKRACSGMFSITSLLIVLSHYGIPINSTRDI